LTAEKTAKCRACPAEIIWATMPSGAYNPLDAGEVPCEVGKGVVAYNPATGGGVMVSARNIMQCYGWAQRGVTFHLSHFATCPERQKFKQEKIA